MANEGYDDIWDWFGFDVAETPEEIIRQVDLNVSSLVSGYILKEKSIDKAIVLINVGRKGAHLFSDYMGAFTDANFLPYHFISTKTMNWYMTGNSGLPAWGYASATPAILLADTIHTGSEMKKLLGKLKTNKIEVKKIFCYLKNEAGLNELVNQKLITKEKVIGLFSSSTEEEYMRQAARLHVFFRSKIVPLDPNLVYDLYNINKILTPEEFVTILAPFVKETFGKNAVFTVCPQKGLPRNVSEIWLTINRLTKFEKRIKQKFSGIDFEIRCLTVIIKFIQKSIDCEFTVTPITQILCTPKKKPNLVSCSEIPKDCLIDRSKEAKKHKQEWKKAICPWCVEKRLAEEFLQEMSVATNEAFSKTGIQLAVKVCYRLQVE